MKLTACIPAYNDAYTLPLCLASIADAFDEILVLDDASTDETPDVAADFARAHPRVRYTRHEGRQLGWIEARNRLAAMTDAEHVFWLDADDVLCEWHAPDLARIARSDQVLVGLRLCELWGDLDHTTQRLKHYDRCHVYTHRSALTRLTWGGGTAARLEGEKMPAATAACPLLFHLKGVKPDRRVVERNLMRAYLRDADRPDRLADLQKLADMDEAEIHTRAVDILLTSRQDKLTPTFRRRDNIHCRPVRPEVIRNALPGRFRMVYRNGVAIDREDRGGLDGEPVLEAPSTGA